MMKEKNLEVSFAGMKLKNPIVVSSSPLTNTADKNKKLEQDGAAAVVLKSLFEEQILLQTHKELSASDNSIYGFESDGYMQQYIRSHHLSEYISLIRDSKKVCTIPVIASLNCFSDAEWVDFALEIENAGADAIELNIMMLPTDKDKSYSHWEKRHSDIVRHLKSKVHIPLIVKLGQNIGNCVYMASQLRNQGAKGITMFNKLYPFDVDVEKIDFGHGNILGHRSDLSAPLRWVGLTSPQVKDIDYAVSGGVHDGMDVAKCILCGASVAQICSVLLENKSSDVIGKMLADIEQWMGKHGYETIADFKGLLCMADGADVSHFERTQFLKYYHE